MNSVLNTNIIKHCSLSASSALLIKITSGLLTPYAIQFLSPDEFGFFSLCNNFATLCSLLFSFGLRQVLGSEITHQKNPLRFVLNDIISIYAIIAMPLITLFYIIITCYVSSWPTHIKAQSMVSIGALIIICSFIADVFTQLLLHKNRLRTFFAVQLGGSIVTVITTVILLHHRYQAFGMLLGHMLGIFFVACIAGYFYYQKNISATLDITRLKVMWSSYLTRGATYLPSLIMPFFMVSAVRWILASRGSLALVGIYAVVEMTATFFQIVLIKPLQTLYIPHVCGLFTAHPDRIAEIDRHNIHTMLLVVSGLFIATGIGYLCFRSFALYILPPAYHQAIICSVYMAIGQILMLGALFLGCFSQFQKKSLWGAAITVITMAVQIGSAWLLIPYYNLHGAMISLITSALLYFLLTFVVYRQTHQKYASRMEPQKMEQIL